MNGEGKGEVGGWPVIPIEQVRSEQDLKEGEEIIQEDLCRKSALA